MMGESKSVEPILRERKTSGKKGKKEGGFLRKRSIKSEKALWQLIPPAWKEERRTSSS